jgi:predicted aspartyl protease
MRRLLLASGLAAATSACVAVPSAPPASSEPGEVPVQLVGPGGAALVVPVTVNGAGPFSFVLDTGATLTCVDEALAAKLDLPEPVGTVGYGGTLAGVGRVRLVRIDSLEVGTARATDVQACAIDLASMRRTGLDVQGLVGLNFLKAYRVTLDFRERTLRLDEAAPTDPSPRPARRRTPS